MVFGLSAGGVSCEARAVTCRLEPICAVSDDDADEIDGDGDLEGLDGSMATHLLDARFAMAAKRRLERVSAAADGRGLMHTMSCTLALPSPSAPCSELWRVFVSFESRKGTQEVLPSLSELTTPASAERLLLMPHASLSSLPVVPVARCFSEPARSTQTSEPYP